MEKLVFNYWETDGYTIGYVHWIRFEYESKDKFIFDILEFCKDVTEKGYIELFGFRLWKEDINKIEENVYTLEEWFEDGRLDHVDFKEIMKVI